MISSTSIVIGYLVFGLLIVSFFKSLDYGDAAGVSAFFICSLISFDILFLSIILGLFGLVIVCGFLLMSTL